MAGELSEKANSSPEREPPGWMFWSAIAIAPFYVWMVFAFFYESWGLLPCLFTAAPAMFGAPIAVVDRLKKNARNSSREQTRSEEDVAAPPQMRAVWSTLAARFSVTQIAVRPSGEAWFFECRDPATEAIAIISAGDEDDIVVEFQGEVWREWAASEADLAALIERAVARVTALLSVA